MGWIKFNQMVSDEQVGTYKIYLSEEQEAVLLKANNGRDIYKKVRV